MLILGLGIVFLSAFGPALGLRSLISALFYRRLVGILLGTIIVVTALVVIRPLWLKIPLENSLIKSGVVISLGLSGIYCSFAVKAIFPSVGIIACFAFVVSSLLKEQEFSRSNSIRRQLLRTDIAILIYASLIAIIIVTVRTAFGFLDTIPSESLGEIIPKFWYTDDPVLAVYNKEHVRLAVLQFFFLLRSPSLQEMLQSASLVSSGLDWKDFILLLQYLRLFFFLVASLSLLLISTLPIGLYGLGQPLMLFRETGRICMLKVVMGF